MPLWHEPLNIPSQAMPVNPICVHLPIFVGYCVDRKMQVKMIRIPMQPINRPILMVVPADIKSNLHNLPIADEFSAVKGYDEMADLTTLFFAPKLLNQLHLFCGIAQINAIPTDAIIFS